MGVIVLHDDERAVLYDTVTETPIAGIGFIGRDAQEQAESFLAYLHTEHNQQAGLVYSEDPRRYRTDDLIAAQARWRGVAFIDAEYEPSAHGMMRLKHGTDQLNDYGNALLEWQWAGPAHTPANALYFKPVPEPGAQAVPDPEFDTRADFEPHHGDESGYDLSDPKHPAFADNLASFADERRKREKGE